MLPDVRNMHGSPKNFPRHRSFIKTSAAAFNDSPHGRLMVVVSSVIVKREQCRDGRCSLVNPTFLATT